MADAPKRDWSIFKYHFGNCQVLLDIHLRRSIEFSGAIATEKCRFGPVKQHSARNIRFPWLTRQQPLRDSPGPVSGTVPTVVVDCREPGRPGNPIPRRS